MAEAGSAHYEAADRKWAVLVIAGVLMFFGSIGIGKVSAQETGDDIRRSLAKPDTNRQKGQAADRDVLSFGLEYVASPGAGDFFEGYQLLSGPRTSLDSYLMPAVTGRIHISDPLRLLFHISYAGMDFVDIYNVEAGGIPGEPGTGTPIASVVENFSYSVIPVMAGIQYAPVRSQFTTYVGLQGGFGISTGEWTTMIRQQSFGEFYRPQTNEMGSGFVPAIRAFTGMDLRFDRYFAGQSFFRGVYVEAAYLYMPLTRQFFEEVRKVGRGLPTVPSDDGATLNAGGFTLTVGVNMQMHRQGSQ